MFGVLLVLLLVGVAKSAMWNAPLPPALSPPLPAPVSSPAKPAVLLPLQSAGLSHARGGLSTHQCGQCSSGKNYPRNPLLSLGNLKNLVGQA